MTPSGGDLRLATMCLFGMINWIYTWYHHGRAVEAGRLADHMMGERSERTEEPQQGKERWRRENS
jgi:hypothetical protein